MSVLPTRATFAPPMPPKLELPVTSPSAKARPTITTKASARNLPMADPKRRRRAVIIEGAIFRGWAHEGAVGRCFRREAGLHQGGKRIRPACEPPRCVIIFE